MMVLDIHGPLNHRLALYDVGALCCFMGSYGISPGYEDATLTSHWASTSPTSKIIMAPAITMTATAKEEVVEVAAGGDAGGALRLGL